MRAAARVFSFVFFPVVMIALAGAAWAGPLNLLPLSGRIFGDVYAPTRDPFPDKPLQQSSLSAWLETDPHWTDKTYAKVIGEADGFDAQYSYLSGASGATHAEIILREGYVATSKDGWELRAGKMILPWGKSDVFNPTDYLTAKNLSFFNPDEEVRRLGSGSIFISYTPSEGSSPWNFTGVFTPFFAQGKLLFPPTLIPPFVSVAEPTTYMTTFENSEIAAKTSYSGTGWDASVSFFNGWNHLPQLQEISHTIAGPGVIVNLAQVYRRIVAYGADASYSLESWVFRFESAYIVTPNDSGTNPLEIPTHWDSVIGAERPLGNNFRIQAQLLMRYFPRYTAPSAVTGADPVSLAVNQQIAAENALLQSYQDPTRPGGTFRLGYTDEKSGWDAEIFFLQNFAGGDFLLRPRVGRSWTDSLRSQLGLELYGGPSDRPLGALASYSAVFLETKYTF